MIGCPNCQENIVIPAPGKGASPISGTKKTPAQASPAKPKPADDKPSIPVGMRIRIAILILLGFAIQIGGRVAFNFGFAAAASLEGRGPGYVVLTLGLAMLVIGGAMFVWGCVNYAQARGYPGVLGGLLGLLHLCGLGLLWLVMLIGDSSGKKNNSSL